MVSAIYAVQQLVFAANRIHTLVQIYAKSARQSIIACVARLILAFVCSANRIISSIMLGRAYRVGLIVFLAGVILITVFALSVGTVISPRSLGDVSRVMMVQMAGLRTALIARPLSDIAFSVLLVKLSGKGHARHVRLLINAL